MVQGSVCTFPFSQTLIEKIHLIIHPPGNVLRPLRKLILTSIFIKKQERNLA